MDFNKIIPDCPKAKDIDMAQQAMKQNIESLTPDEKIVMATCLRESLRKLTEMAYEGLSAKRARSEFSQWAKDNFRIENDKAIILSLIIMRETSKKRQCKFGAN